MSLSRIKPNGKIGILGAGVSGLSYAYFVNKLRPDISITIFEKSNKAGGWIQTTELYDEKEPKNIIRLEKGPRSLRGASEGTLLILDILKKLGHGDEIKVISSKSKANTKYLMNSNYEIVPVPHSFTSFIRATRAGIFSGIVPRIFMEPFRKPKLNYDDESVESFFKRRFGSTIVTDKVLSAILHGIYAGDVSKLSVKIFPNLQKFEQSGSIIRSMIKRLYEKKEAEKLPEYLEKYQDISGTDLSLLKQNLKGYPMIVLEDKLSSFPQYLATELIEKNIKIVYNSNVQGIDLNGKLIVDGKTHEFDHIRSTINVSTLSKLIKQPELNNELESVEYVTLFLANIYTKFKFIPKQNAGFGFLVPKISHNKEFLLGTIFDSSIQSYCTSLGSSSNTITDHEKITLMFGGHNYNSGIPSTALLIKAMQRTLAKVFDLDEKYNFIIRDESTATSDTIQLADNDVLISYNVLTNCIPQYNVGYEERKQKVQKLLEPTKLSLGGMCFARGIGVPDCVSNSLEDAIKIS